MDNDTSHLIEANKDNLARVIGFVSVIDAKAQFVLTLVLALTSFLSTQLSAYLDAHQRLSQATTITTISFVVLDAALFACIALFFASATVLLLKTIAPRTAQHTGKCSPLFFGTIACLPHEDFKKIMRELTPTDVIDRLADQTYDNAKIVTEKAKSVTRSVKLFLAGVACFLIFTMGRSILLGIVGEK
ncbi:MAG: hypothetical protein IPP47_17520 [Bryobacterales bacterium]|nr:hypothetical protein [Bryobacterales bacterium]